MDYLKLPRRLVFKGDVDGCQKYIGRGNSLLSLCEKQASFRELKQSSIKRTFNNGVSISASISFGLATIEIYCPPPEASARKEAYTSNFIVLALGDEANGYHAATYNSAGERMQSIFVKKYADLIKHFPPVEQEGCYTKIKMNALKEVIPATDCPAFVDAIVVDCEDVKAIEQTTLPDQRLWASQYVRQWGENPTIDGEVVYDVYQETVRVGEGVAYAPVLMPAAIYTENLDGNINQAQTKGRTFSSTSYFGRYWGPGDIFYKMIYDYFALGLNIEESPIGVLYPDDKYITQDSVYVDKKKELLSKGLELIEEFSDPFEVDASVFWFGLPYRNWTGAPDGDTIQGFLPLQMRSATNITEENPNGSPYKTVNVPLVFPHRFTKKSEQISYQIYLAYYKEGYYELNKENLVFDLLSSRNKFYIAATIGPRSGSALKDKRSRVFEKNIVSFLKYVEKEQASASLTPEENIPFTGKLISYISDVSVFGTNEMSDEYRVFFLLNEYRRSHGLQPLTFNYILEEAAMRHALDMAQNGIEDHPGSDGSTPLSRVQDALYFIRCDPTNPGMMGENLAWGQLTPEAVMAAWKASPGHNSNMLYEGWRDVAISKRIRADGKPCWVQVFGALPEAIGG